MKPDKRQAQTTAEAPCACGAIVTFAEDTETGEPLAFHPLPPCDDYVRRELVDYIAWLNHREGAS